MRNFVRGYLKESRHDDFFIKATISKIISNVHIYLKDRKLINYQLQKIKKDIKKVDTSGRKNRIVIYL